MRPFPAFVLELVRHDRRRLAAGVGLTTMASLTGGFGILLVVPLLSVAGLSPATEGLLGSLSSVFGGIPEGLRLTGVLAVYIVVVAFQAWIERSVSILHARITNGFTSSLRTRYFDAVTAADWEYIASRRTSDLVAVLTQETGRIGAGAVMLLRLVSQALTAAVQLGVALLVSAPVTLLVAAAGSLFYRSMNASVKRARRLGGSLVELSRELQSGTTEQFGGFREIRSYGIESRQREAFASLCGRIEKNLVDFSVVQSLPGFFYKCGAGALVSLFVFAGIAVFRLPVQELVVVTLVFARLWPLFPGFQTTAQHLASTLPAFEAYRSDLEALRLRRERTAPPDPSGSRGKDGDRDSFPAGTLPDTEDFRLEDAIECRNLVYVHPGEGSFRLEIGNLRIPARCMSAVVGPSGAGKSTLADLLAGLVRPVAGSILVDGTGIGPERLAAWRRRVAYVPQEPYLLNDTILENLVRFNPGTTRDDARTALYRAAAEFVFELPDGLDTMVGDRGLRLSGGERQRIVFARALLRSPLLLVLDEATSALDSENESRIQRAVEHLEGSLTVLVIAHRLTTIRRARNVAVLEGGKVVEQGSYAYLSTRMDGRLRDMLESGTTTGGPGS